MGSHYQRLYTRYGCSISACCDPTPEKLHEFADRHGIPERFIDYRELLDTKTPVDGIIIAAPDYLHIPVLSLALARGVPVMCEKPFAGSLADCSALPMDSEVPVVINFSKRNAPAVEVAKRFIDEGALGEIITFAGGYDQGWIHSKEYGDWETESPWAWRLDSRFAPAGVVGDLGSHLFDLVEHLIAPAAEVRGQTLVIDKGRERVGRYRLDSPDAFQALVRTDSGAAGELRASRIAVGMSDRIWMEIFGSKGSLRFDLEADKSRVEFQDADAAAPRLIAGEKPVSTYRNFLALIQGAAADPTTPGLAEGLRNQRCIAAVLNSSAERQEALNV